MTGKNITASEHTAEAISSEQLTVYHKIIQIAVDPDSPFYGKSSLNKILRLPVAKRKAIYEALPEEHKKMLAKFVRRENEKVMSRDNSLFC